MSIPVPVEDLTDTVARYGYTAFLLTTSDDGRPHATHVALTIDGAVLECELGRRTAKNGAARGNVSLLWPPIETGGYSLIVDGDIEVTDGSDDDAPTGAVTATKAVLHRPAVALDGADADCGSDCLKIEIDSQETGS